MSKKKTGVLVLLLPVLLLSLAADVQGNPPLTGDLIHVASSKVTVGVLLDELPADSFSRVQAAVLAWEDADWAIHALQQISFTTYKLAFLSTFYKTYKGQLMLPADNAAYQLNWARPAYIANIHGHVLAARDYSFTTYLVGTSGSACASNPNLCPNKQGKVSIPFFLPADPFLHNQRTLYACMDEDQFPRNAIDSENSQVYYDDTCAAGPITNTTSCNGLITGCHCSQGSTVDCHTGLKQSVGMVPMDITFTVAKWDEAVAQKYEAYNSYNLQPTATGADLVGWLPGLAHNWFAYQYFPPQSCSVVEGTALAGWRKLLIFDSIHVNEGPTDMLIGNVKYFAGNANSFNQTAYHNMYYWGQCHQHPHFPYYSEYEYDVNGNSQRGHKQGFCIQSTNRIVNSRNSPIFSNFQNCSYQGVTMGWADNYNGGIPGQWIDMTGDESTGPVSKDINMFGNPQRWLCEGAPTLDAGGNPKWVFSGNYTKTPPYPTPEGLPIDIYQCVTSPGAWDNNHDQLQVLNPGPGQSLVTLPCSTHGHVIGPKRDCEFTSVSMTNTCTAGQKVTLTCTLPASANSQVLRLCESSWALRTGTACRFLDSSLLANTILAPGRSTAVTFTCPAARDPVEVGGLYSVYQGAVYFADAVVPALCA